MDEQKGGKVLSFAAHKRWLKHYLHKPFRRKPCACSIYLPDVGNHMKSGDKAVQVPVVQPAPSLPEPQKQVVVSSLQGYKNKQEEEKRKQISKQKKDEFWMKFELFFQNMCDCHFSRRKWRAYIGVLLFILAFAILSMGGSLFLGVSWFVFSGSVVVGFLVLGRVFYLLAKSGRKQFGHSRECHHFTSTPPQPKKSA